MTQDIEKRVGGPVRIGLLLPGALIDLVERAEARRQEGEGRKAETKPEEAVVVPAGTEGGEA